MFEVLTHQITRDIIKTGNSPCWAIIKKYFSPNTEIGKEFRLYNLFKEGLSDQNQLLKVINIALIERSKLNEERLNTDKFNLIKELKKVYDLKSLFSGKVKNYRINGAIQTLFETKNPAEKLKVQDKLIQEIKNTNESKSEVVDIINELDKPTRTLAFKLMIEKFNEKYGSLLKPQKNLLSLYLNESINSDKFKNSVIKECNQIQKELKTIKTPDQSLNIKLVEISKLLEDIKLSRFIKEEHVSSLMKYYELINTIK